MEKPRPCGCKGIRTCLICEHDFGITKQNFILEKDAKTYVLCPLCNKAWPGWDLDLYKQHPNHEGTPINFPGVYIELDFLTIEEEKKLMEGIDEMEWDLSQSGRRKQNFGPKCNFKKQRLKLGEFKGFPLFSKFVQEKFTQVPILKQFHTIEQCSLEYDPSRGASIDPHIDDCWIWGERVVTVNLLSSSTLTMTRYLGNMDKYNLKCVPEYPRILNDDGRVIYQPFLKSCSDREIVTFNADRKLEGDYSEYEGVCSPIVRIPMPRRSLLVIYGAARYDWEHRVLREDIKERRVCLAYREFTPPYLDGEHVDIGHEILKYAKKFWCHLQG
ncbi:hypothetical protein R5R35_003812 [Gryllus longicercus]|uniref:Uncharacterized protein n=1 Tax=Gryllus longicercus TaxID=2509291 RepID=A0AAN9VA63_9ORTH